MERLILLLLFLSVNTVCFGQEAKSKQVVEGVKAIVDIVTLVKGGNQKENCVGGSDICFENKTGSPVEITLLHRERKADGFTLTIPSSKTMCKLEIPSGIYECKVTLLDTGDILSSGDLKLSDCKKERVIVEN